MLSKDQLLKGRLPEREVEIPDLGTVRVRGLSRAEVLKLQKLGLDNVGALERKIVHLGLVDPALTEAEVDTWYEAAPGGELEPVSKAIQELSGLVEGAEKAAYKSV